MLSEFEQISKKSHSSPDFSWGLARAIASRSRLDDSRRSSGVRHGQSNSTLSRSARPPSQHNGRGARGDRLPGRNGRSATRRPIAARAAKRLRPGPAVDVNPPHLVPARLQVTQCPWSLLPCLAVVHKRLSRPSSIRKSTKPGAALMETFTDDRVAFFGRNR